MHVRRRNAAPPIGLLHNCMTRHWGEMYNAPERFINNVRRELRRQGWTQTQLAERAGMARQHVSNYLSGVNVPSLERAERIAEALGLTVSELLLDESRITILPISAVERAIEEQHLPANESPEARRARIKALAAKVVARIAEGPLEGKEHPLSECVRRVSEAALHQPQPAIDQTTAEIMKLIDELSPEEKRGYLAQLRGMKAIKTAESAQDDSQEESS